MIHWMQKLFRSSIGRKSVMAVSGLLLTGFLVAHLAGNLLLFKDQSGAAFDGYERMLTSNPLLPLAEAGLLALFVAHIVMALVVAAKNSSARSARYEVEAAHGGKTFSSKTMLITGLVVLGFLVIHILDFRVAKITKDEYSMFQMVKERLSSPLGASVYIIAMLALGLHLRHAFQSALQTLGLNHPRWTPLVHKLSIALALILALGFASIPMYFLATSGQ